MNKMNRLLQNPHIKTTFNDAISTAKNLQRGDPTMTDVRKLLRTKQMSAILESMIELSPLPEPQRIFLKEVFIKKTPRQKAIKKAIGTQHGYDEEKLVESLVKHPVVKEFVDLVKLMYIQVAPIAALKEVEMILNPTTKQEVRLDAIKDVQNRAGIRSDSDTKSEELPVQVIINMPTAHSAPINTQVNVGEKK